MNEGIGRPTVDQFVGAGFSRRVREAHD